MKESALQLFPLMRVAVALIAGMVVAFEWGGGVPVWVWLVVMAAAAVSAVLTSRWAVAQSSSILLSFFFLARF